MQVRDFDVERIETVCSGEALEVAAELRGLLNESTRVNVRKGGAGAVPCVSQVPSVRHLCQHERNAAPSPTKGVSMVINRSALRASVASLV